MKVGPRASGKTSLVKLAAQLAGRQLDILNTNSAMDTTELLGGFEQVSVVYFYFFYFFCRIFLLLNCKWAKKLRS